MMGSDDTALLPLFLLKIRSVRMLDGIVSSGALFWLFSLALESWTPLNTPWKLASSAFSWSLTLLIKEHFHENQITNEFEISVARVKTIYLTVETIL
jgi:hypothetical protein